MKTVKRIISFACVVAMLMTMCVVTSYATDVTDSWTTLCAKYSKTTSAIIAPRDPVTKKPVVKTEGFTFVSGSDGGVKITSPTYEDFKGVYPVSCISSKYKTSLDGLSVKILPDDMNMNVDNSQGSTNISVIFSEEPINEIATLTASEINGNITYSFTDGLASSVSILQGSFRHLAPMGSKSLVVTLSNQYSRYDETQTASTVAITYFDGSYINIGQAKGFRWTFTARNNTSQSPNADASPIVQPFEEIDFSEGLIISFRADETHGFIVNINGKDYYKGEDIAYFPDCNVAAFEGKQGGRTYSLTDDDYNNETQDYLESMTAKRADIDLSALKSVTEGYVTVGASGNGLNSQPCAYTVSEINTKPAATWKGEPACEHENVGDWEVSQQATCGADGLKVKKCLDCGKVVDSATIPATGLHTSSGKYTVTKAATCIATGVEEDLCTVCGKSLDKKDIPIDPDAHNKVWSTIDPASCSKVGSEKEVCSLCNTEFGTREIPKKAHTPGGWTAVKEATYLEEGLEKKYCTVCKEELDSRIISIIPYENPFPDVDVKAWYASGVEYCVKRGYFGSTSTVENLFSPYMELTREQLMMVLANVGKVNLSEYTGASIFSDVPTREWYSNAVKWAGDTGVTSGIGNGLFGLGQKITREQLGVLFMNYVDSFIEEVDHTDTSNLNQFKDASSISSWAKVGLSWAVEQGLLGSTSTTVKQIEPGRTATRAEAARIIMVFNELYIEVPSIPL